ncbi:MAG: TatD family hydrolase [Desulfobulbaceae bacterium]|nr:TatD family hydrolase [Desulfobulbaceae bacterium]
MSKKKKKVVPLPDLPEGVTAIDTHCHLDMKPYRHDLDHVLGQAGKHGVSRVITVGIDETSSRAAIALSERYDGVYATVGVHPHNVEDATDSTYETLREMSAHPKVIAYGEVGMDRVKKYAPVELQKEHYIRQVRLAKELNLPLIIHDREAHDDIMEVLTAEAPFPVGGVMHCFSGDLALAERVVELGLYVSIPGVVTFHNAKSLQEVAAKAPLSSLLLETDGPFLAPEPKRGKRNEPLYVLYTAMKVAQLRGVAVETVLEQTTANARRLFRLA